MTRYISNPRPLFDDVKKVKKSKRLSMGSTTAGIIMDIDKEGIYFNGYYQGINRPTKYAVMSSPGFIAWEELDKIRNILNSKKKKKNDPDFIDNPPEEYLKTLPIVTLNGMKYYIDTDRKERRLVERPQNVFKF